MKNCQDRLLTPPDTQSTYSEYQAELTLCTSSPFLMMLLRRRFPLLLSVVAAFSFGCRVGSIHAWGGVNPRTANRHRSADIGVLRMFDPPSHQNRSPFLVPTLAIVSILALTTAAPLPAAAATDSNVLRAGQQVFDANCASCHLGGANFVNEKRTLQKEALTTFGVGVDTSSIQKFLTQDSQRHKSMAFFRAEGGKLTPEQWGDAASYVADQAQGDKW